MNNVKKSIGWADWTWNPVTGCKNTCYYCYARKMYQRFNSDDFSNIKLHPDRLQGPGKLKKAARIFVGSMSDCSYWSPVQWHHVYDVCSRNPQHTFMFLTKRPAHAYIGFKLPDNCMAGATVTSNDFMDNAAIIDTYGIKHRAFISIEPITGPCDKLLLKNCELVIVGAMTGNGPGLVKPRREWVDSVKHKNIFYKSNILKYFPDLQGA